MGMKQLLRKNRLIDCVWCVFQDVKKYIREKRVYYYLKKERTHSTKDIIRVAFIVQLSEIWDKQADVFHKMLHCNKFDPILLVVPESEWGTQKVEYNYKDNFFLKKYGNKTLKAINERGKCINVKSLELDYVFYPRPYDAHLPKELRSDNVMKYAKCCYIPYGFTASDNFNGGNVYNPFFDNIYFGFLASRYMCELLEKKYSESCKRGLQHFEYCGYPILDRYILAAKKGSSRTITWTPRWSNDAKKGGSNFLQYKDEFIKFVRRLPEDVKVLFRPHPLMFDELIKKKLLTIKEKEEYINELNELEVEMCFKSPISEVLDRTDILLTDFSTIIGEFFMTNRPIVYCEKGIPFNKVYQQMEKYMYVTNTWDEVEERIWNLLNYKDEYKAEREKFIIKNYQSETSSAEKIMNRIMKDWEG